MDVTGADFSDVLTTGAHASGIDWSKAKVQPAELPEPIPTPPWVRFLVAGVVIALVFFIMRRRRKA